MRSRNCLILIAVVLAAVAALAAYRLVHAPQPQTIRHQLTGYVLEVTPEMNRITVRNADIPGTMASMVMDYRVKDPAALDEIKPGDVIQATMVTGDVYWLEDIKKVGTR